MGEEGRGGGGGVGVLILSGTTYFVLGLTFISFVVDIVIYDNEFEAK